MVTLASAPVLDTGNTSWLLASTALVLLMTPGLALFYGGLNRVQERAQHDDDELLVYRAHLGALDPLRIQLRVRHQQERDAERVDR